MAMTGDTSTAQRTPRTVTVNLIPLIPGETALQAHQIELLADGRARAGSLHAAVENLGADTLRVTTDNSADTLLIVRDGSTIWVFADGIVWIGRIETSRARARDKPAAGHDTLSAPMPATVLRLLVSPGTAVQRGETVMVLEAMKMELPIRAERDGVIKSVACREGELVQPGVPLLEIQ
jgi:biotin carboxyl carrier protein